MKGTEKQIAYAQFFVDKFDVEMNGLIEMCPEQFKTQWVNLKEKVDLFFEEAYAGDVIELLKPIRETGKKYYVRFVSRVRISADPLCNRIKKEFYDG